MNTRTRIALTAGLVLAAAIGNTATASTSCKMKFTMSGWSAFYKRSSGSGTITCSNGQSIRVRLEARGGGPSIGKSKIKNGNGEFSPVESIDELPGSYASAEASAGAVKAAKAQVVTKGEVSLALSGTGEGWDIGVAFGKFTISRR